MPNGWSSNWESMTTITNRPRLGCYSLARTGSAGICPAGRVASGSKVNRVYI